MTALVWTLAVAGARPITWSASRASAARTTLGAPLLELSALLVVQHRSDAVVGLLPGGCALAGLLLQDCPHLSLLLIAEVEAGSQAPDPAVKPVLDADLTALAAGSIAVAGTLLVTGTQPAAYAAVGGLGGSRNGRRGQNAESDSGE